MADKNTMEQNQPDYATAEQLFANCSPEPLERDAVFEGPGLTVRVRGISKAHRREEIYAEIALFSQDVADPKSPLVVTHPVSGESYAPKRSDVVAAAWAAHCVIAPKLSALQWLQLGAEYSLDGLYAEALICSRMLDDKKAAIVDGVEAAEAEIEADPLASTSDGTSTASKS